MESFWYQLAMGGVLAALISGLISLRMQTHFFNVQATKEKEKELSNERKRREFILKAFRLEAQHNLSISTTGYPGNHYKILFDTYGYSIFKEDIALVDDEIAEMLNKVYLCLSKANSEINGIYGNNYEILWTRVEKMYSAPTATLNDFIASLNNKIKNQAGIF